MDLTKLHNKLNFLNQQKQAIEKEIQNIKQQIQKQSSLSKEEKIELFKSLFIAREDIYAFHWISKDGKKQGYAPATYTFKGKDYIPVNNAIIQKHLEGKIRIGTYAIINQNMAKFLVLDLDKHSFIEDTKVIDKVCKELNLHPLFEISKSGEGIHIWLFFSELVLARKARQLGDLIITKAMDISNSIDIKSYDRMFPNQDYIAPNTFGNLIALPLHYSSRQDGKTLFVEIDTLNPFLDQWEVLKNVSKISLELTDNIIANNILASNDSLVPWEVKRKKPIKFPKNINAIIYDAIYIEKESLSVELVRKLQRFASFLNPEFYRLQALRKSTYKTPRVISLFSMNEKFIILPRGILERLKEYLHSNRCKLNIKDKRVHKKIEKLNFKLTLKKEQQIAYSAILKQNYSLLIAPPGFGKTAVACAVISKRRVNTLILVHKTTLLEQWINRLCEYFEIDKKSIGLLGDSKKRVTKNLDIAMLQSLKNRPKLIKEYSQIIIDEVHHIPAISFDLPLRNFCGKYILGLSATPKRQDGMHPIMYMQCGDIAYEAKQNLKQNHTLKAVTTNFETMQDNFALILNELVELSDRNSLIIETIVKIKNRNILVLSERVEHLNILHHMLRAENIKSTLLHGSLPKKIQKVAIKEAQNSKIILSTSTFFGEGIDLAHLDTILLTMPISYEGRITQYLGRVGRRGQKCLAIDFVDINVPILKSSFNKRLKAYRKNGYIQDNIGLFGL